MSTTSSCRTGLGSSFNMKFFLFSYLGLLCINVQVQSDPYGVIFKIQELTRLEAKLIRKVQIYVDKRLSPTSEEKVPGEVVLFLAKAGMRNNNTLAEDLYMANPVNVFHLLQRAVKGWDRVKELLSCEGDDCPDLTGGDIIDLYQTRNAKDWPKEKELLEYAISLLHLWKVYRLDVRELARGKLGPYISEPMTLDDIMYIATTAKDLNFYYEAIQWFTHALKMAQETKDFKTKQSSIYKRLAAAYDKSKMTWKAIELIQELIKLEPENEGAKRDLKYYQSISPRRSLKELLPPKKRYANLKGKPVAAYEGLCRGERKSAKSQSRLFCMMEKKMIPYAPLKAEVRNKKPLIMLYHDLLTPKDLFSLRKSAEIVLKDPVKNGYTEYRRPEHGVTHAHSVWLDDIITRNRLVSHKIEDRLGFSSILRRHDIKNTFQVTNFAPGSSFIPPWDIIEGVHREDIEERPTRVVKTLVNVKLFLSDVAGGATVFPYSKARVPVTQGGAAVWIDNQKDDYTMRKTISADCPVLRGFKWAAAKWMHPIGIDMTKVPVSNLR